MSSAGVWSLPMPNLPLIVCPPLPLAGRLGTPRRLYDVSRDGRRGSIVRRSAFCVLALLLFLPGCGSDDEETASPATEPTGTVTGEFVGTASDDETYVGIFVGAPTPGTGSSAVAYVGNRRVRLDGITEVAQWFTGPDPGAA